MYPNNIKKVKTPTEEVETPTEVDDFKNAIERVDPLQIENCYNPHKYKETLSNQTFDDVCCQTFTYNT